jgi:(p)ppGpp synthase/HD superfamily hydrolase
MALSAKFDEALDYAHDLHRTQVRKGPGNIPYVAHLMSVSALVLEAGGSETQAIAALLHDGPEDRGGAETLSEIERRFGSEVAAIVDACSDTMETPKPPWRERKLGYVAHLADASEDALLVSLADKVHNARAIVSDQRVEGDRIWERFSRDSDQGWYYGALLEAFRARMPGHPLVVELELAVAELQKVAP